MELMGSFAWICQICIISSNLTSEIQILISNYLPYISTWMSNRNLKYNTYKTELLTPASKICKYYNGSHLTTWDHHSPSCSWQKSWQHPWLSSFSYFTYSPPSNTIHCLSEIDAASKHVSPTPILPPYSRSPLFLVWTTTLASLLFSLFPFLFLQHPHNSQHVPFKT